MLRVALSIGIVLGKVIPASHAGHHVDTVGVGAEECGFGFCLSVHAQASVGECIEVGQLLHLLAQAHLSQVCGVVAVAVVALHADFIPSGHDVEEAAGKVVALGVPSFIYEVHEVASTAPYANASAHIDAVPVIDGQALVVAGIVDEVGGIGRMFGCGIHHEGVQLLLAHEHPLVGFQFGRLQVAVHHIPLVEAHIQAVVLAAHTQQEA